MANWNKEVDLKDIWPDGPVFGDDFNRVRDAVVERLRESDWDKGPGFARRIANTDSMRGFNYVMEDLWTAADRDRVWIATVL